MVGVVKGKDRRTGGVCDGGPVRIFKRNFLARIPCRGQLHIATQASGLGQVAVHFFRELNGGNFVIVVGRGDAIQINPFFCDSKRDVLAQVVDPQVGRGDAGDARQRIDKLAQGLAGVLDCVQPTTVTSWYRQTRSIKFRSRASRAVGVVGPHSSLGKAGASLRHVGGEL